MKLLHTADWHLGKTLKGQNLLDDQKYILDEIFEVIDDQKPDAILICGDIYDRGVPPIDAVDLFNETLTKLAERNLPTLIIAGNHDSATRLNFGSELFARQNIFIAAKITDTPAQIVLNDKFGEIYFSMIPFFEPGEIKSKFFSEDAERLTYNDANKFYVDLARQKISANKRSVALAHVFLTGGVESDSERKIVGTLSNVNANIFSRYNYIALGHLHKPQKFYSGSPLKYSFDEANHKKSVTIVDIDGVGNVKTEKFELTPRRDVKVVTGTFNELIKRKPIQDYVQIILTDDVYIYETEKLRDAFPNFLEVKRENHLKSYDDASPSSFSKEDSISEQFANFFKDVMQEPMTNDEQAALEEILREVEREER
ncbi:MAG: exonuclease SbcCD subunit D [Selenomonadaceae bacterium]|nr:exonuclease SbcCD subunit D [Selenomonadaceae bacterium]